MQYTLKTYKHIALMSTHKHFETILKSYYKIGTLINFFRDNIHQYHFTGNIRFNILFYLALLQDMANKRAFYYAFDPTLYLNIYDTIPNPTTKNISLLHTTFNPILEKITDEKIVSQKSILLH